jgi:hypothetical protein
MQCFRNWICLCRQVIGWEAPTLLDPLESTNINHWIGLVSEVNYVVGPVTHWVVVLCPSYSVPCSSVL